MLVHEHLLVSLALRLLYLFVTEIDGAKFIAFVNQGTPAVRTGRSSTLAKRQGLPAPGTVTTHITKYTLLDPFCFRPPTQQRSGNSPLGTRVPVSPNAARFPPLPTWVGGRNPG
jgi:hypothetical protein